MPQRSFQNRGQYRDRAQSVSIDWERLPIAPAPKAQVIDQLALKLTMEGRISEYVLDKHGVEKRKRCEVTLCTVRNPDGTTTTEREAQRLLQPIIDKVNSSIASPATARKSATFTTSTEVWERDYLSLCKPATRASERSNLKRLRSFFDPKDMRLIEDGDLQRFVASCTAEPEDHPQLRGTASRLWDAAFEQKYVDAVLEKPTLPRRRRPKARS